ncbi:hypothetical protein AKO1_007573 [Acrasis kona]|uniref:peptidyl-tRNA hydrolase n=1 Tax=Acrasis kona TaxID=1008807 RepID=A0AAW2ZCU8_9EUKA
MEDEIRRGLLEMGFTNAQAEAGMSATGCVSLEHAIQYILSDDGTSQETTAQQNLITQEILESALASVSTDTAQKECKMVMVVRTDLGMKNGKIAAQCGHAVLGAYRIIASSKNPQHKSWLSAWSTFGEAKVAVKCNSEKEMEELRTVAESKNIITYMVIDQGRTQIPANSKTVLAIGPAPIDVINEVTRHLKLL